MYNSFLTKNRVSIKAKNKSINNVLGNNSLKKIVVGQAVLKLCWNRVKFIDKIYKIWYIVFKVIYPYKIVIDPEIYVSQDNKLRVCQYYGKIACCNLRNTWIILLYRDILLRYYLRVWKMYLSNSVIQSLGTEVVGKIYKTNWGCLYSQILSVNCWIIRGNISNNFYS